jgi:hypothetical protein
MVEFFFKIGVRLAGVVNVERSFFCTAALATHHPICSS